MLKEAQLRKIIDNMSAEEKALQLTQVPAGDIFGSVIAEDTGVRSGDGLNQEQLSSVGSALSFSNAGEAIAVKRGYLEKSRSKIPLLLMHDVIHGFRTIFPIPIALGCTFDTELVEECARIAAVEARVNGVDVAFSPMVDLARDARWGRVMETSGEDPYLNGVMGRAYIRGYKSGGIACCVKHFAGYGAAEGGREYDTTDISRRSLMEYYLRAYRECLKENPEMVMTSFNLLNGIPVNGRKDLLVDLLREEWVFDGVVISDFCGVREMIAHGYIETEKKCAEVAALNCVDIEMVSTTYANNMPRLIGEGRISKEHVDKMVRRVLNLKDKLGLFENPEGYADEELAEKICLSSAHRTAARKAAGKACVLLKNDGVLPLEKSRKIALVGPFAEEKTIIGAWSCAGRFEDTVSVAEGLKNRNIDFSVEKCCSYRAECTDERGIARAVESARSAEVIIACIGEPYYLSGESSSRSDISVSAIQIKLLKELSKLQKPVVSVVFGGRPQVLCDVERYSSAILYAWQPGTEGGNAVADILYGEINPSAKLASSFPRATGQCPIYYNRFSTGRPKKTEEYTERYCNGYIDQYNTPLYPFGYGLSYTEYEYSPLKLSSQTMHAGERINATVRVKNVGKMDGEETVFLFLQDKFASVVRPVMELKAFKKVKLKAGEEREVSFTIDEEQLKFFDADGRFVAEDGEFNVMAGRSSRDFSESSFVFKS